MALSHDELKALLLQEKLVDAQALAAADKTAQSFHQPLDKVLLEKNLVNEDTLGVVIARRLGYPFVNLRKQKPPAEALNLVPENLAVSHGVFPFARTAEEIHLAMVEPRDFEAINFIQKRTGLKVVPYFAFADDVKEAQLLYKRQLRLSVEQLLRQHTLSIKSEEDLARAAQDVSIIQVLETILEFAIAQNASDVHLEIGESVYLVRFRIDGLLHDIVSLPKTLHPPLVARIKILSNLKIDEHRVPQDGRFRFQLQGLFVALRVSIVPAFFGENVVLRILREGERPSTLEELGITGQNLTILKSNMKKPNGLILVTGPTGSGKTTTLYSILNILNTPEVKICTIEDPIEYGMTRISQIQVNVQTGLTFAEGLRALLRHDPDVIMIGEIRDDETATIAIHSALTGHLVLSTLHTSDAPSALPRFVDMGAEPFLLASTVNLVVAQRLVRKICPDCAEPIRLDPSTSQDLSERINVPIASFIDRTFFRPRGCTACGGNGYRGRIGIYEMFEVNDDTRNLILQKAPAAQLRYVAVAHGMITMALDGINKALQKLTTVEEVLRVTKE